MAVLIEQKEEDVLALILPTLQTEAELQNVVECLDTTIKFDTDIKTIIFLCCLLTFTEHEQPNISMSGETTIGKTYCVGEVLRYFPIKTVVKKHSVSKLAFFYDEDCPIVDKETLEPIVLIRPSQQNFKNDAEYREALIRYQEQRRNSVTLQNWERKIVWLPDLPDAQIMEKFRALLSHDDKIIKHLSTTLAKYGHVAKNYWIKGFPVFIICSANAYLDDQDASRMFQINPEWSKEKEKACLDLINKRQSSPEFLKQLELNPKRLWLKHRILKIQSELINEIYIPETLSTELEQWFLGHRSGSVPKDNREYARLCSLAKAWCLFNLWTRTKDENRNLYCNETDIEVAKTIYIKIIEASSFNLSLEQYKFYLELKTVYEKTNLGIPITDASQLYYLKNGRPCADKRLRNMLNSFCREGLMRMEKDKQKFLYYVQNNEKPEPQQAILDARLPPPDKIG